MRPTRLKRSPPASKNDEVNGTSASAADEALKANKAKSMTQTKLKILSPADKALEANGARPMRSTRLKKPSPANKVDKSNGWESLLAQ